MSRGETRANVAAAVVALALMPAGTAYADAIGLVHLDGSAAGLDADYEHSNHRDGVVLIPAARLTIGEHGFLEGNVAFGWVDQLAHAALGNVTAMGGYRVVESSDSPRLAALALRVTAPSGATDGPGGAVMAALAAPRVSDPETLLPNVTSVELLGDWRWSSDRWWLQLEGGAEGRYKPHNKVVPVLRVSVAGALRLEPWLDLTASFITRSFMLADSPVEDFVHVLVFGAVTDLDRSRIAVRIEVPVDHSARIDGRYIVGLEVRGL